MQANGTWISVLEISEGKEDLITDCIRMDKRIMNLGIFSLLLLVAKAVHDVISVKKVFISFDYSEDVNLRNLLEAWTIETKYDFSMNRTSPLVAINSDDESVVKRALTRKMKEADYLLVIVGPETACSKFVQWEIERAMEPDVNLKIAAVKRHRRCKLPKQLRNGRASWSPSFTIEGIKQALRGAKRIH